MINIIISFFAFTTSFYEILSVWILYIFIVLIFIFATSFSKYDDKAIKEKGIKTKHLFKIENFKLYKDNVEVKSIDKIKYKYYKKYIFLKLKTSYFYIPNDDLSINPKELSKRLREVIYQTSNKEIINNVKNYISNNDLKGDFEFVEDRVIWYLGKRKFTFYIDLHEVYVNHEKKKRNIKLYSLPYIL